MKLIITTLIHLFLYCEFAQSIVYYTLNMYTGMFSSGWKVDAVALSIGTHF